MPTALVNGRVLVAEGWREDLSVVVADGRVRSLIASSAVGDDLDVIDLEGDDLVPGFIDLQVNGGGGVLFNDTPTAAGIAVIAAAHRRLGTTGLLPTLISGDLGLIDRAMRAVEAAIDAGTPGVLGIHLEGPFLNPSRRGAHDAEALRPLDEAAFRLLCSLRRGRTLVTLAPETTNGAVIARLTAAGVLVCAGHTDATYAQTRSALRSGLRGFTHLFNAMAPMTSRAPGVVGAALEHQTAFIGLIVDGWHVSPTMLRLVLKTRPLSRFMLVSDAMPTVGADTRSFLFDGRRVHAVDGACRDETGALTGSDLHLALAVDNAVKLLGLTRAEAASMASAAPAAFLGYGRDLGLIAPGVAANLVRLRPDGTVGAVWSGGVVCAGLRSD